MRSTPVSLRFPHSSFWNSSNVIIIIIIIIIIILIIIIIIILINIIIILISIIITTDWALKLKISICLLQGLPYSPAKETAQLKMFGYNVVRRDNPSLNTNRCCLSLHTPPINVTRLVVAMNVVNELYWPLCKMHEQSQQ